MGGGEATLEFSSKNLVVNAGHKTTLFRLILPRQHFKVHKIELDSGP